MKAETENNFKGTDFLTFDTLTMAPIQIKLIEPSLLEAQEIADLNDYHQKVLDTVGPLLKEMGQKEALNWLIKETKPIG